MKIVRWNDNHVVGVDGGEEVPLESTKQQRFTDVKNGESLVRGYEYSICSMLDIHDEASASDIHLLFAPIARGPARTTHTVLEHCCCELENSAIKDAHLRRCDDGVSASNLTAFSVSSAHLPFALFIPTLHFTLLTLEVWGKAHLALLPGRNGVFPILAVRDTFLIRELGPDAENINVETCAHSIGLRHGALFSYRDFTARCAAIDALRCVSQTLTLPEVRRRRPEDNTVATI